MNFYRPAFSNLAFSALVLTALLTPAHAQDTTVVAQRLKALLANQGMELSWTGISGNASRMVLEGVSMTSGGEDPLSVGDVTLEGISEDNGGFTIDTVSTQAFSRTEDGVHINTTPFIVHGLVVPAEGGTDALSSILFYRTAELENMTVRVGDKTAFSMDNFSVEVTPPSDGQALQFSGGAEKFTSDLTLVEDQQSRKVIEALGYQNISGSMEIGGSWQPSDGKVVLSRYDITVDDAGTFGMSFDFSGYTTDFIKSLQEMQKKMADKPEGADNSAEGMAMLGLLQQLTFNGASVRFTDDSLTNKILEYVAKQQGMSPKDVANQAKAIVPFGMAQLNNPELTAQVTAAVSTYLDNPKSIEIAARPSSPVPFALIMAGAMSNPADLTKTLGVSVRANEN